MSTLKIEIEGMDELQAKLQALTGRPREALIPTVAKYALMIQTDARNNSRVDTGGTRRGFLTDFSGDKLTAAVGSDDIAALYQEQGTGPAVGHAAYFPPPDSLTGWAHRHGLDGLEFVIARSIFEHGTPAHPVLGTSYAWHAPDFIDEAGQVIQDLIDQYLI